MHLSKWHDRESPDLIATQNWGIQNGSTSCCGFSWDLSTNECNCQRIVATSPGFWGCIPPKLAVAYIFVYTFTIPELIMEMGCTCPLEDHLPLQTAGFPLRSVNVFSVSFAENGVFHRAPGDVHAVQAHAAWQK